MPVGYRDQNDDDDVPDLLLSVPFYVYEELSWQNATYRGQPVGDAAWQKKDQGNARFNHGDDYFFIEAALKHPMRTRNILEAKLFFVPFLLNHIDSEFHGRRPLCLDGRCNYELLDYSQKLLRNFTTFKMYPERHVIVRSFFCSDGEPWNKKQSKHEGYNRFMEIFPQMTAIVFESRDKNLHFGRQKLSSYYVATPCELSEEKPYDVAMIASMKDFADRKKICRWLKNATSIKTSVCGRGSRCPALAQSKFGFHAPGDTWGSQRLMDIILSGSVPLFTHTEQYKIQGAWIDWDQLSYYLPVHNDSIESRLKLTTHSLEPYATKEIFLQRLEAIIKDTEGYERRHKAVLEHIPLFDYATLYPFDTFMYMVQADVYPETRHRKSQWSALILPPPHFTKP
mmetsp:Transcript_20822/g.51115  ORF Transcript_20822/g.51115 Transcript_20822/m.51115 type:complete len:397 (+) Transcript_20822:209-1399(+)